MSEKTNTPDLHAYAVSRDGKKPHYTRIGGAWKNAHGGYGIRLNALPVNNEILLFPPREDGGEPEPSS